MTRRRITYVIQENLQNDLHKQVIADGYGLRGKSKWVCEAIENLINITNFEEIVRYSEEMESFNRSETVVMDEQLKQTLDNSVIHVRKKFPMFEGVQSSIIRTAIIQRLLQT